VSVQLNHLLSLREDVARRWQGVFADGVRIRSTTEIHRRSGSAAPAAGHAGGVRLEKPDAVLLWIDFDLFVARSDGAVQRRSEPVDGVIVLDSNPSFPRAMRSLRRRAHAYCHAWAAPEMLRRVAASVERGEFWIGREWVKRIVEIAGKGKSPALMR